MNKLEEKEALIPVSIFSRKLSSLETIVKYLKENYELNYSEIGRDSRTIWTAYRRIREKQKE